MAGRTKSLRNGRVRWFSDKPKRRKRRRSSPRQLASLRLRDLAKLFRGRYGTQLPDDDAGRDDVVVALNHLAHLPRPLEAIDKWIEVWAPWLTIREQRELAAGALQQRQVWKADELAWRLHVTAAERARYGLTTIGAIDETSAARLTRRETSNRERQRLRRRANGVAERSEYLARSVAKAAPWKAEGISRATWYRRRKGETETGPCAP